MSLSRRVELEMKIMVPRTDTDDSEIWDSVVVENSYLFLGRLDSNDIIIDIGAHIGSFAHLAEVYKLASNAANRRLCNI